MQRSSESIAKIAGALAKAQSELVNPEKSLVATIYPEGSGEEGRCFNYASLASGLEIVRKTLGQHEIAVVQTTAIDQPAGIVNLTTLLAHSSGEWLASEWPVCAVKDIETPHRTGAALTYARRYALFTLVGIAGEDDLDAPDLQSPSSRTSGGQKHSASPIAQSKDNGRLNGGRGAPSAPKHNLADAKPILNPDQSALMRDRLLGEIEAIASADDAALWAYCNMRAKNSLSTKDAERVEGVFQARLAILTSGKDAAAEHASQARRKNVQQGTSSGRRSRGARRKPQPGIDKTVLTFPEPRRIRDREHVRFVAKQTCLICGRHPCDPHHLRFVQSRALGRKVSDEFTVPLCRGHHREVHHCGDEAAWWSKLGIDPTMTARALWLQTRPLAFGHAKGDHGRAANGNAVGHSGRGENRAASPSRHRSRPVHKTTLRHGD